MNIYDDYFDREGIAAFVDRSPRTIDRMDAEGTGPPVTKIGVKKYYRKISVLAWLADLEREQPRARCA